MKKLPFTKAQLKKFDSLIDQSESRNQMERISGRLAQNAFVRLHGKEKCDLMWAELQKRDGKK